MNDITRLVLSIVICLLLFGLSFLLLTEPVGASEYISNFERTPAVENAPIQVGTWSRTPTVIVCEHTPLTQSEVNNAVRFWSNLGYHFFGTETRIFSWFYR